MEHREQKTERVLRVLDKWPEVDRSKKIPTAEFVQRRKKVWEAIAQPPCEAEGLARFKPYTGTHNAGYTECQEFYGAITLESEEPLDRQVVTMLDVALRGRGSDYNDVAIPGFDFFVVEDTLGKFGDRVENLAGFYNANSEEKVEPGKLPIRVQDLILSEN